MEKPLKDCSPEELAGSPMNLYLYAATVLKGRLPPEQHEVMERLLREKPDECVRGYFSLLSRKTLWGRIRGFLGL